MKIFVCHDWFPDVHQTFTWKDGLSAALRVLSQRHEVFFATCTDAEPFVLPHEYFPIHFVKSKQGMLEAAKTFAPDVILHWADCTRENAPVLAQLGIPMALCFAGGDTGATNSVYFDHIFVESEVYKEQFEAMGLSVSTAFGTNTELFKPLPDQQKYFDVIFPATYCDWKRHDLFNEATRGLKTVTAGFMYPEQERYCWEDTRKGGALTLPHVSAETLQALYAASRVCLITSKASGGSQRTVLEALSMDLPVIVAEDSDKTSEYIRDLGWTSCIAKAEPESLRYWVDQILSGSVRPRGGRDYVLSKWSEHHYADALEAGLKSIL